MLLLPTYVRAATVKTDASSHVSSLNYLAEKVAALGSLLCSMTGPTAMFEVCCEGGKIYYGVTAFLFVPSVTLIPKYGEILNRSPYKCCSEKLDLSLYENRI